MRGKDHRWVCSGRMISKTFSREVALFRGSLRLLPEGAPLESRNAATISGFENNFKEKDRTIEDLPKEEKGMSTVRR